MREILPDIFTWAWFSEPHGYDFNGYLVRHSDGNLCIDPVPPEGNMPAIVSMGVARIVITNRNHSRAANAIRERTGAPICLHADDAPHAVSQGTLVEGELLAGDKVGPLVIEPVPGKSPGEVALHWPERRVLFVGDAVIGNPAGQCSLLREKVIDDITRLRNSVRNLMDLDFDALLFGDGVPILRNAKDRLRELVERFPR